MDVAIDGWGDEPPTILFYLFILISQWTLGMDSEAPSKSSFPSLSLSGPSTRTAGLAWERYKGAQPNEELRKAELDLWIWISQNSQDRFG
jgi:hypothetical protein